VQAVPLEARTFIGPLRILASCEMSYWRFHFTGREFLDLEPVDLGYQDVEAEMADVENSLENVLTLRPPPGEGSPGSDGLAEPPMDGTTGYMCFGCCSFVSLFDGVGPTALTLLFLLLLLLLLLLLPLVLFHQLGSTTVLHGPGSPAQQQLGDCRVGVSAIARPRHRDAA
jgi:hypothetical protein